MPGVPAWNRHPDDTTLSVTGEVARQWISIAQSFAGPPGPDRKPGLGRFRA